MEICSLCGLFGNHQGHKIVQVRELKEISKRLIGELDSERKQIKHWGAFKTTEQFVDLLRLKVKEQFQESRKKMDVFYNVF